MSDFPALDDFNDFSAGPTSSSAAGQQGDFLARERELLGDEFGPTPTGLPSASDFQDPPSASRSHFPELDDAAGAASATAARPSNNDFVSSFQRDPAPSAKPNSASVAIDDDDDDNDLMGGGAPAAPATEREDDSAVQQFQSQYPDLQLYPPQDESSNNAYASSQSHQNGYSQQPSAFGGQPSYSSTPVPAAEPESEAIRAWREKQKEDIAKRDAASAERKEEIIRKAEKAIDDFYATYNQKKEKQISANKENEAAFIQARDDALGRGTTWERIAEMIDLQDSRSKTAAKGTRDLSRMKEILLSLKREGDSAPNASGY